MHPETGISESEIRAFLEAVQAASGYDLRDYDPRSIRRRLMTALARSGLPSLAELQRATLSDARAFARLIDDLTVRVTSVFRDPAFYRAFRARVVPLLRTYPSLRIWHAGCSTGEEVYSVAVVLDEEGLYDRTQLYATDLNAGAIERAKQGIYSEEAGSTFAASHAAAGGRLAPSEHVTPAYAHFAFREHLKKNVLFFHHDLVNDHVFGEMQVVFCRNVLMYFGPELRRSVLAKLASSLAPGGFLCLGSAERIGRTSGGATGFVPFDSQANIYRKQG